MSDFNNKIAGITEILTLPEVVMTVNRMIDSPDTTATDIAKIISSDIALSTKVLKLVNSSFYGFSRQITNINYAVVILGFNTVRNLAMTAFIMDIKSINKFGFNSQEYWVFSVSCATVTEMLSQRCSLKNKDNAFITGLVHDLGVIILNQFFTEDFGRVFTHAQKNSCLLIESERAILGYTHIDIGVALLESWNLPPQIIDVCKNYSTPELSDDPLNSIVYLSDILCRALCLGNPGDNSIQELMPMTLKILSIDESEISEIMRQIMLKTAPVKSLVLSSKG